MAKEKVSWVVGKHNWAYDVLAKAIAAKMPDFQHTINGNANILMIMSVDQLSLNRLRRYYGIDDRVN